MKHFLLLFLCVMSVCASEGPQSKAMQEGHIEKLHNIVANGNSRTDVCCIGCVGCCCFVPVFAACVVHDSYVAPVRASIMNMMHQLGIKNGAKEHQE